MLNVDENELIEFFGVLPTKQDPEEQEFFGTAPVLSPSEYPSHPGWNRNQMFFPESKWDRQDRVRFLAG